MSWGIPRNVAAGWVAHKFASTAHGAQGYPKTGLLMRPQMGDGDILIIVEGILGILWKKVGIVHIGFDCRTFSWAALATVHHRSLNWAAITMLGQDYEKVLAALCRRVAELTELNPAIFLTLENPSHSARCNLVGCSRVQHVDCKGIQATAEICGFVTYAIYCAVLRIARWAHLQLSRHQASYCCSRST